DRNVTGVQTCALPILKAFDFMKIKIPEAVKKQVFPRMTEVVLERNFDINLGKKILAENNFDVQLSDSQYAYHINSKGINKANGRSEERRVGKERRRKM